MADTTTVTRWQHAESWTQTTVRVDDKLMAAAKIAGFRAKMTLQDMFLEGLFLRLALMEGGEEKLIQAARGLVGEVAHECHS